MYIKNRHLQLLPDGNVNGTLDENSDYTILQRTTVNYGQVKIQGAASCLYLCMDSCGFPYSSREFSDECVFNEMIDLNHYNSYSSRKYSGNRRTIYLALDARGRPRRVAIPAQRALGKLSGYVRVMPRPAHRALHGCTKHRQASITSVAPPHPHHTKRPCRIPKKKRKCKEGERPVIDNCEKPPRRLQPQKCPPHKPDCAPARNATQPLHIRHKRPLKPKKPNKQDRLEKAENSQTPQNKKRPKKPLQKNKRKVGRAPDDIHGLSSLTTNSWEIEEEGWMSTSDEMLSSTQVEDVTSWEFTTNSGFSREFFRGGSAVLETAEEDDT